MFRTKVDTMNKQIFKRKSTAKRGLVSLLMEYDSLHRDAAIPMVRVESHQLAALLKKQIQDIMIHIADVHMTFIPAVLVPAFLSAYYNRDIDSNIIKHAMGYVGSGLDTVSLASAIMCINNAERVHGIKSKYLKGDN